MVFRYSTEQQAIEARQRIATAEGLPKHENSKTIYYLNYQEIDSNYYIDARNEIGRDWYESELNSCDDVLTELPIINDIDIIN